MAAYYNEFDKQKAAWLRELIARGVIAPGDVDERSIADVRPGDLAGYTQCHFFAGIGIWSYALRLAGWRDDREVWTGSCPCQPFSAAGKGEAFNDERHLWPEFFRLIEARRPVVCFGEQVASIDGLTWLDLVQADLDRAGYTCGAVDLCAAGVGAPHWRQRLYWVADGPSQGLEGTARPFVQGDGPRLASSVAHSESGGRGVERDAAQSGYCGHDDGSSFASGAANASSERRQQGDARGMADADGWNTSPEGLQRSREHGQRAEDGRHGSMARGPVNGFWSGADWVLTRPQRLGDPPGLRPVERRSFPLAHGTPQRVGRLRGYGDGIVAQAAQAFIEAYLRLKS
jgi:DNA (cytosine-5)-methyltransferase 1